MSVRFDYVKYDDKSIALQLRFKSLCTELEHMLQSEFLDGSRLPSAREAAVAMTKLEDFYSRCGRAIRDKQRERDSSIEMQEGRSSE